VLGWCQPLYAVCLLRVLAAVLAVLATELAWQVSWSWSGVYRVPIRNTWLVHSAPEMLCVPLPLLGMVITPFRCRQVTIFLVFGRPAWSSLQAVLLVLSQFGFRQVHDVA
jgi:hypothetical protein